MNGAHDMGGAMGFGSVATEIDEPVFHAEWEKRVLAMNIALGPATGWNIDQGRFARENVPPHDYLSRTYYEIWFAGLVRLLAERGIVDADEIAASRGLHAARPPATTLKPDQVAPMLAAGRPSGRQINAPARFKQGDRVRARNIHPASHTRLPRYVRGHAGTITLLHGVHVFPDTNAAGLGEAPQWLYTVRFTAHELWGEAADPTVTVSVDAWESYLEPVA